MINFIQNSLHSINSSLDTVGVLSGALFIYLSFTFYKSYTEKLSNTQLIFDFTNDLSSLNFYYETPHFTFISDFIENNMIFYNILLSRSLHRRLSQPFERYKAMNGYDFRSYTNLVNRELFVTHEPVLSYPLFFETYINLKEQVIAYELSIINWYQTEPPMIKWFTLPKYIWVIPPRQTNLYWTTTANDILFETNFGILDLNSIWFFFLFFFFIFFFFIFTIVKYCKKLI